MAPHYRGTKGMSRGSGSLTELILAAQVANHRWDIGFSTGTVQIDKEICLLDEFVS